MKTLGKHILIASGLVGWLAAQPLASAQAPDPQPAKPAQDQTAPPKQGDAAPAPKEAPADQAPPDDSTPASVTTADGQKGLRLNFRNAPLETVLDYLSEAAGFIIDLRTEVKGKINVWSQQPLSKDEAVEVLKAALERNGCTAIVNGRTLTIFSRDDARKQDLPVRSGNNPDDIPKTEDVVTQVIAIRYINATQLSRDLQPLVPDSAKLTANEGGNAIILTDSQAHIHRIMEIIRAIDTAISSVSSVRVFPLKFADAKSLASVIKDVFQTSDTAAQQGNVQARFAARFRGFGGGGGPGGFGGGPGGFGGGGGGGGNGDTGTEGRPGANKVTAVADDRSNSLVVSAPEDLMKTIEGLVKSVDTPVQDVTEVRVFRLKYADPNEMANLLYNLFPDPTTQGNNQQQGQVRFGGGFGGFRGGGGGGGGGNAGANESDRMKKQTRVIAVPDPRTYSIVVSASHDLMDQIEGMVAQLDSDASKKQKVFVYSLQNADAQQVQQILQDMFQKTTSLNSRNTANQNSVLTTRGQANQQTAGSSSGNTGFGGSRGGGGGVGGGGFQ